MDLRKIALGSVLAGGLAVVGVPASRGATIWVEAESFADRGGWAVDTQSVEQMGSPYLIAHGMGTPVAEASTTVSFPAPGEYAVWVRTRNWVPAYSNDAAPGRFAVAVGGANLAPVFGAVNGAWHWQAGGTVAVTGATAALALRDLTGFDGRCDAVVFISDGGPPPPDGGPELAAARRAALGEAPAPESVESFDCVIVGGGMAGCCAALAAARSGVRTALVHDRTFPGGNASQEVRVATRGEIRHAIVDEIDTMALSNRSDGTVASDAARLAVLQAETNLTLYLPWRAYGAGTNEAGRIAHVDARHTRTGQRVRLQAPIFIDCTGDGWIGYWAGAEYRVGREGRDEFDESRAPAAPDAKTMGNSLMWTSRDAGAPRSFPAVPWAMAVAGTRAATGGEWNWEYGLSLDTIEDAETIRDHLLRAIYGNFYNAKQDAANANLALHWVPYIAGKRESRRLMGDHLLIQSDVQNGVYFEDAVGTATWGIDLHYETSVSYLTTYTSTHVARWYFPFRCLYSRNVPNLMMAGRCISVSHVGLGSPRVQNTTGQMGVAVGYAAALCREYGIEPRDIYRSADRTVELQARITGSWPQRPPPSGAIVDNADPAPAVNVIGDWTSSAYTDGYVGSDYLHDGNAGTGGKRVAFIPALDPPGAYAVALRWTDGANRASNTPVWVCTDPAGADLAAAHTFLRNTQPDTPQAASEMLVGRVAANDYLRGLLRFDLSAIPAGAVIVDAELRLAIGVRDAGSADGFVGADGLRVYRVTEPFVPAEATWNRRIAGTAWTTPGGAYAAEPLAVMADPTDPNLVEDGEVFVLPPAGGLTAAASDAMGQGTALELLVRTPSLESTYPTRKIYRFTGAALAVTYFTPQLPATYTVDQRTRGGQWITLGSHVFSTNRAAVIVGNDGADGYVIADAVQFYNPGATTNDLDGDGLVDAWERYYFLSETRADPEADDDGDGRNNRTEFMTGTDPRDPYSRFDMRGHLDAQPGALRLNWASVAGRTYCIEVSDDLASFSPLVQGLAATPPENAYTVTPTQARRYYRVALEP